MSTAISQRLVKLRNEKNLIQKEAARELGVSQALLSHYEKGIRECGLDFLCRASVYYDASTDYLLGLTDSKITSDTVFDYTDLPQDEDLKTNTIIRATAALLHRMEEAGNAYGDKVRKIYILTIFKIYLRAASLGVMGVIDDKTIGLNAFLSSGTIDSILATMAPRENTKSKKLSVPLCVKTVSSEAVNVVKEQYETAFVGLDK